MRISGFKFYMVLVAFVMISGFTVTAEAFLINRGTDSLGRRLIYDDALNLTWYDHTEIAPGNVFDTMAWADSLVVDFGGTLFDDWRLPTGGNLFEQQDFLGITEFEHLYDNDNSLNADGGGSINNPDNFQNLFGVIYWSSSVGSFPDTHNTFDFFNGGTPLDSDTSTDPWGLAVRQGDVAATSVPEPTTIALLGIGLVGLAGVEVRRRRKKRAT